jgi:hypothetical protein
VTGDLDYRMPYLVRGDRPWHYVGRTHEHLSSSEPFSAERFDDLRIAHHADGGTRGEKFERDLLLLSAAVAEKPDDPRSLFYLAQTRRDMGDDATALTLYRRRVEVGGWDEETFYALYQAGLTEDRLGRPESTDTLQAAWDSRPTRAEPLYQLARINRLRRRHHLSWIFASLAIAIPRPEDLLFVEGWVYLWGAQFELADAAWRIGENARAVELARDLLKNDGLPEDHRAHLEYILELLGPE